MAHWLYSILIIGTIFFPLVLSFDKKVAFWKKWKFLFPAILPVAIFFLVWDYFFTRWGIWSFNPDYIQGKYLYNLPWEEVSFFFVVPYSCLFIYECLIAYFPKDLLYGVQRIIAWCFAILCLAVAWFYSHKLYTALTGLFCGIALLFHVLVFRRRYLGRFFMAYFACILPMLIVNGILTAKPVVIYNNTENLGIRMGTIPVEDFFYNMLLLLMITGIYEWLKRLGGQGYVKIHHDAAPPAEEAPKA